MSKISPTVIFLFRIEPVRLLVGAVISSPSTVFEDVRF